MNISRRQFIGLGVAGASVLGAGSLRVAKGIRDTSSFELQKIIIKIANLPKEFENYRIGFVTDIHLGRFLPTETLEQAVKQVCDSNIDLLLLGGDYIWLPDPSPFDSLLPVRNEEFANKHGADAAHAIYARVADIAQATNPPDGVMAVLGNHDNWVNPQACLSLFESRGILTLENKEKIILRGNSKLSIYGVQDYWTGIPSLPKFDSQWPKNETRILLSHNPDFTSELLLSGNPGFSLALSGHTHGGQLCYPLVGALYYNIDDLRFASGLFELRGLKSYTSRGLGVVEIPYRLNCPAEVTVIELIRA